ncbi:MAG: hypothetical protein WC045_00645 [Patescibacteria group bacterium]
MDIKNFFWNSEIFVSFTWVIFFLTLNFTDPRNASVGVLILFFSSLFISILGTFGLLELRFRLKKHGYDTVKRQILTSLRHGIMFGIILVGLLGMTSLHLFKVFDGIVFVTAVLLLEAYFWSKKTPIKIEEQ